MPVYQSYPPSLWETPASTVVTTAPTTAQSGSAAFTLNVTGTGFSAGSVVSFDGDARPTTYVDETHLTAQVAGPTGVARTVQVTVSTGGTAPFTITAAAEPEE